jgi:hypothetical protein
VRNLREFSVMAGGECFSEVIAWYYYCQKCTVTLLDTVYCCYRPNIHTQDSWHSHPIIIYNLCYPMRYVDIPLRACAGGV